MTPALSGTSAYLFPAPPPAPLITETPIAGASVVTEVPLFDGPLSPSSVNTYCHDCQVKFLYRKVLELPEPPSAALALGSAVHRAIAENFRDKLETGEDLPVDGVAAIFRYALDEELSNAVLQPDESVEDLLETGAAIVRVYMDQAAPLIEPLAVEMPVSGTLGGVPVHGYVDILDVDGRVIDIKTAGRKPSGISASHRLQLATYAMLCPGASGEARIDTVTKTKTVALHQSSTTITPADRRATEKLYSLTKDAINAGIFVPNRSSFLCGANCAFRERCMDEFGGVVE